MATQLPLLPIAVIRPPTEDLCLIQHAIGAGRGAGIPTYPRDPLPSDVAGVMVVGLHTADAGEAVRQTVLDARSRGLPVIGIGHGGLTVGDALGCPRVMPAPDHRPQEPHPALRVEIEAVRGSFLARAVRRTRFAAHCRHYGAVAASDKMRVTGVTGPGGVPHALEPTDGKLGVFIVTYRPEVSMTLGWAVIAEWIANVRRGPW